MQSRTSTWVFVKPFGSSHFCALQFSTILPFQIFSKISISLHLPSFFSKLDYKERWGTRRYHPWRWQQFAVHVGVWKRRIRKVWWKALCKDTFWLFCLIWSQKILANRKHQLGCWLWWRKWWGLNLLWSMSSTGASCLGRHLRCFLHPLHWMTGLGTWLKALDPTWQRCWRNQNRKGKLVKS